MAAPATTGQLRTDIASMEIGDYIPVNFALNYQVNPLYFYNVGTIMSLYNIEIPTIGLNYSTKSTPRGYLYMIKVSSGILVGDRVAANSISWDEVNRLKSIQGGNYLNNDPELGVSIRSLTGGVAYADASGNKNTSSTDAIGAWPTNNEWDKYINNFPKEKVGTDKTYKDIFNTSSIGTWTQDTIAKEISNSDMRVIRRGLGDAYDVHKALSNTVGNVIGFRPVFQYKE